MENKTNCTTCRHFAPVTDPNNILAKQGQCYFNPPSAQMMQTQQGTAVANIRPVVSDKEWCSQHTPQAPLLSS